MLLGTGIRDVTIIRLYKGGFKFGVGIGFWRSLKGGEVVASWGLILSKVG